MIKPKSLTAVVLSVKDLEKSLAWYREKFGFDKLFDDNPNSPAVIMESNGIRLALNPLKDPDNATDVDNARQVCVQLFSLQVDEADLDRVAAEFPEDHGIVELDDHPRYRSRIVEDIDGHSIELIAWK